MEKADWWIHNLIRWLDEMTQGLQVKKKMARFLSTCTKKVSVGLIGARGYTGAEFIKLIDRHPQIELACVSSRQLQGKPVELYTKSSLSYDNLSPSDIVEQRWNHVDCWVMALPNKVCEPFVNNLLKSKSFENKVVLDLSADYRFNDSWTYGFPERYRETLRNKARLISNPGCYATGMQAVLWPASKIGFAQPPAVFGVSGYSGAGTKPSKNNDPVYLSDNLIPYKLQDHIHEREVGRQLNEMVHFTPCVGQFFRGIVLVVNIVFKKPTTAEDLHHFYTTHYQNEKLIRVLPVDTIPVVKHIANQHHVEIGGFTVSPDGHRATMVVTIDNLLKGAATQAVQNINLAFGFDEYSSILFEP
eukprot:Lithocolla_globosa_v1_NODE_1676_length_2403_cov_9.212521.p1 type:complete len:359 gc:universal NODE_1676_length_2403_cov_9.212521:1269-2345(+)